MDQPGSFPPPRGEARQYRLHGAGLDESSRLVARATGNARPIRALADDEVSLDNYRAQSPFNSPVGDVFAGGATANDNYVILSGSHGSTSMCRWRFRYAAGLYCSWT